MNLEPKKVCLPRVWTLITRVLQSEAWKRCKREATANVEHLLESMNLIHLDIKTIGNTLSPRYNVYADCGNFSNDKIWSSLCSFLLNTEYTALMQGRVNTDKFPFRCSCCHGVNHLRGLCPFPSLPGWNRPERERNPRSLGERRTSEYLPDCHDQRQKFASHNWTSHN